MIRQSLIGFVFAVLACSLAVPGALAACDLAITNLRQLDFTGHTGQGYEVFDKDQHSDVGEVTIERRSGNCSFIVGFSAGASGAFDARRLGYGGNVLGYQLYKTAAGGSALKDIPTANESEVFTGSLSPGQGPVTFQFHYLIPLQQIVPPGTYQDTVTVRVYEGTLQKNTLVNQGTLSLSARVPAVAEFCFGNEPIFEAAYRNACVDFGELRRAQVQSLMLHARSNTGYRITMRSPNGGALRNLDPSDPDTIPYTMQIDGAVVSLAGAVAVPALSGSGVTSAQGTEHTLTFTIGDMKGASAGSYQDVIEVTMYPSR